MRPAKIQISLTISAVCILIIRSLTGGQVVFLGDLLVFASLND